MKIVLTGGGTAGHIMPNLALLPQLKKHFDCIYYIGSENGMEKDLASKQNEVEFFGITCDKLRRSLSLNNLIMPFKVIKGYFQSKKLLKKLMPDVVFSKGGFVSLPVVFAAKKLGIPTVIHESDMSIGLTNRLCANKADLFMSAFPIKDKKFPKIQYFGAPIRRSIFHGNRQKGLKISGFSGTKPIILILGGSSGATAINETVRKSASKLNDFDVILICGKNKSDASVKLDNLIEIEFTHEIENLIACADIAVSRCGAGTAFELIATATPTLFIPLPKSESRGDQIENAEYFSRKGYAKVILQEDLTEQRLISEITALYKERREYIEKMKKTDFKNVDIRIVNAIIDTAQKGSKHQNN